MLWTEYFCDEANKFIDFQELFDYFIQFKQVDNVLMQPVVPMEMILITLMVYLMIAISATNSTVNRKPLKKHKKYVKMIMEVWLQSTHGNTCTS